MLGVCLQKAEARAAEERMRREVYRLTAAQVRQRAACRAMADDAFTGMNFEATCAAIIEHLRLRADAAINDTGGTDVTVPGLERLAHEINDLATALNRANMRNAR